MFITYFSCFNCIEILVETKRAHEVITWLPKFYKESPHEYEIECYKLRIIISCKR
jgi:hypothetical protein